jgi:hypothetical protein
VENWTEMTICKSNQVQSDHAVVTLDIILALHCPATHPLYPLFT